MTPADLKSLRLALGLSQTAFGEALGVGRRAVTHWESGQRHPSKAALKLIENLKRRRPHATL